MWESGLSRRCPLQTYSLRPRQSSDATGRFVAASVISLPSAKGERSLILLRLLSGPRPLRWAARRDNGEWEGVSDRDGQPAVPTSNL